MKDLWDVFDLYNGFKENTGTMHLFYLSPSLRIHIPCSPQMAYVAGSPVFSDKERYPNFYRAVPPEPPIQFGEGILIDHFKWTEVAYIAQNEHSFSYVSEPNMIHY